MSSDSGRRVSRRSNKSIAWVPLSAWLEKKHCFFTQLPRSSEAHPCHNPGGGTKFNHMYVIMEDRSSVHTRLRFKASKIVWNYATLDIGPGKP